MWQSQPLFGDSNGEALLREAQRQREQGNVARAEQLFSEALKTLVSAEHACTAAEELGRMLEENGLYERALDVYGSVQITISDELLCRHFCLAMKLGRREEALSRFIRCMQPTFIKSAAEGYKYFVFGELSALKFALAVPEPDRIAFDFACGAVINALRGARGLQTVGAVCCFASQLLRDKRVLPADQLSCSVLRAHLVATQQDADSGALRTVLAEASQSLRRAAMSGDWKASLQMARACEEECEAFVQRAAMQCPAKDRFKVWMAAALVFRNDDVRRAAMLQKACHDATDPHNKAAAVILSAKLQTSEAEKLYFKAWRESHQWKAAVALSHYLVQNGRKGESMEILKSAIQENVTVGRLWAMLALQADDLRQAKTLLATGLRIVPRCGELWTARGRILARNAEWDEAAKAFQFAKIFTPQFGDVYVEMMRTSLYFLICNRFGRDAVCSNVVETELPSVLQKWDTTIIERECCIASPNHGDVWDNYFVDMFESAGSQAEMIATAKKDMIDRLQKKIMEKSMENIVDVLFKL
jgi:tetratricopeptide (TPR) repeat protein